MRWYILDEQHRPVKATLHEWEAWSSSGGDKRVAFTDLGGGASVSTVFLGLDHRFGPGPPVLFETMVFLDINLENTLDLDRAWRYSTWDEAVAGHADAVAITRRAMLRVVNGGKSWKD